VVVPGDRAGGDGGGGGGSNVQPERRFGSGSGARGRRGALVEIDISLVKAMKSNPEVGSMRGAGLWAQLGGRMFVVGAVMPWDGGDDPKHPRTYLGNVHGAISQAGKGARRAQAGPRQHGRHTL
jgi:hypothetical protein